MDYHILTGQDDGNAYMVVHHIPIPVANNRAGISYRTVLVNSKIGGSTALPDGDGTGGTISTTEKLQITTGELFEYVESFNTYPGETALQLRDRVDIRFNDLTTILPGKLQNRLSYFGFTRDVP